jgi:mannose-1-phosphate guanylyltransferase
MSKSPKANAKAVPTAKSRTATKPAAKPPTAAPGKARPAAPATQPAKAAKATPRSRSSAASGAAVAASDRYVIIMAGGRGERFWPVSREKTPKQLIRLLGKRSFLQEAVDRVLPVVPARNVLVITNAAQIAEVRKQLPNLPAANLVAEPVGRDTCAAVALGAALVGARSQSAVMAVLPADHVIPEPARFQQVLSDAFRVASLSEVIVTIGIAPTEPATGYGYIRLGPPLPPPAEGGAVPTAFFRAEQFVEKPNLERATEYLKSGQYRWNAGMFVWSFPTILHGLQQHQPDLAEACGRWRAAAAQSPARLAKVLAAEYPGIRKISIDFALLEKATNVVAADGSFAWDDLGAWPALARHLPVDAAGNAVRAEFVAVDAARNIVFDARTKGRTPVTLVGVKECIVVFTDDATLVATQAEAQQIKELVRTLAAHPQHRKLV